MEDLKEIKQLEDIADLKATSIKKTKKDDEDTSDFFTDDESEVNYKPKDLYDDKKDYLKISKRNCGGYNFSLFMPPFDIVDV